MLICMRIALSIILICLWPLCLGAAERVVLTLEDDGLQRAWVAALAKRVEGETEVRVPFGRVDIVTDRYAIEVDWVANWHCALGQAIHYAHDTKKKPVMALCLRADEPLNEDLLAHIERVAQSVGVEVWVIKMTKDEL